jgi:flavodoxin short chain
MEKIQVVYWTQGGNTGSMAASIGQGISEAGKEPEIIFVSDASISDLKDSKVFALGCPAMGDEVLEESEMEPFVCDLEPFVAGKTVALFGSYGWGDGQWMRDWVDRMTAAGAKVLNGEGLMSHETPDDEVLAECVALGKQLAEI